MWFSVGSGGADAQNLGGGAAVDVPIVRIVLGLGIAVVLSFLAALYLKRSRFPQTGLFGAWTEHKKISLLESQRISPTVSVVLLSALGRQFLVMIGDGQCTVLREEDLSEIGNPDSVEEGD